MTARRADVAIRAARPSDAAAIAAIYAPHVLTGTVSFETEAPDADAIVARMAAAGDVYPWLVPADGETVLGYAYAGRFRERAAYRFAVETTIYLADAVQRRGIGRRLYGALLEDLRGRGFTQAIGVIALPNDASVALHEALGFRAAGRFAAVGCKFGRWVDVGYWQCALADRDGAPY
ncbi:arsinothricin resistance N-acetyltransferase ArsN1 family B [Sphingomonas sp. TZW2008]|uniref:arsinothricin resistance N-acetyltransferase ArsN1 family B n=1 Tax=Sphingomonas sp. TZW2008 TaxID=1917973 RepID=UPI000A26E29D|nr:arsinothricin resistance N-acetyltransferase ArsN1 family B [Sphingomonas sp. TZW2008]